jgi:hypothetical protein
MLRRVYVAVDYSLSTEILSTHLSFLVLLQSINERKTHHFLTPNLTTTEAEQSLKEKR